MKGKTARPLLILLSIALLLGCWQIAAAITGSSLVLPAPLPVFARLGELVRTAAFWTQIGGTLYRCFLAFCLSLVLSLLLGIAGAFMPRFAVLQSFPLTVIKATPVVSFILLAVFWFSSGTVPVFVSVLMTLPVLTGAVASGLRNTDKKLLDMAAVYSFSLRQKIRYVYVPAMLPSFFSGCLAALGLTWKVVVAGEVLTLPKNSVGQALQTAKVHLETADVFAWTIAVIFFSYGAELLFAAYTKKIRAGTSAQEAAL